MIPETTIVIAAYNEKQRLPDSLGKIQTYLAAAGHRAEVIVVDDGSTDKTAELIRTMSLQMPNLRLISYPNNRGKGFALRTGVLSSRGEMVLVTDADLSTPIEELETLRALIDLRSNQIAIGSRALPSSDIQLAQPFWRRGMGQLFNLIVKRFVIADFHDTQCGFKLFAGELARNLFEEARINRFAWDVEILALARRGGYGVVEVPVSWKNSTASRVRPIRDSLQMVIDLVKIRLTVLSPKREAAPAPLENLNSESVFKG